MQIMYKFLFVFLLISNSLFADEASNWLKKEVDYIYDLSDELLAEMMVFSKMVAKKIENAGARMA